MDTSLLIVFGSIAEIWFASLLEAHTKTFTKVNICFKTALRLAQKSHPLKLDSVIVQTGSLKELREYGAGYLLDHLFKVDFSFRVENEKGINLTVGVDLTTDPTSVKRKKAEIDYSLSTSLKTLGFDRHIIVVWQPTTKPSTKDGYELMFKILDHLDKVEDFSSILILE